MTVYQCSTWPCGRLISVSRIRGGNPVAKEDPEHWSIKFAICRDCKHVYCDRCLSRHRTGRFRRPACWSCGGALADGRRDRPDVEAQLDPPAVQHLTTGKRLAEEKRYQTSLAELDRAVALRPAYAEAHFYRGVVLGQLGRDHEAIESFEAVAQLDPLHVQAMFELGCSLTASGRVVEAVAEYDRALAVEPRCTAALVNRGIGLAKCQRLQEALASLDEAIRLEEADQAVGSSAYVRHYAYGGKGNVLLVLGRYEEAIEALQVAIATGPDSAPNYCNLARALRALGQHQEAGAAERMCQRLGGD